VKFRDEFEKLNKALIDSEGVRTIRIPCRQTAEAFTPTCIVQRKNLAIHSPGKAKVNF
jgi:hypothetical protein